MIKRKATAMTAVLLCVALGAGLMSCGNTEKETEKISDVITEKTDVKYSLSEVNGMIDSLVSDEEYKKSDIQQRKEAAQKLLDEMKQNGIIGQYSYSEEDKFFSFEYSNGTLGGISLKGVALDSDTPFPMN